MNGADSLEGLAVLGKTAVALALVVGLIVLCAWLVRRLGGTANPAGHAVRVVASTAVGPKERVVVVAVADTWLVLGVGGGQVSKLHELQAPPQAGHEQRSASFASRLAEAVGHRGAERVR
ncbi:MAG: flagellar biosynthetic protein FliO [Pseudomonas sp.]